MATLSTHLLNSTDGTHAGHVGIRVFQLGSDGQRVRMLDKTTDDGGRFPNPSAFPWTAQILTMKW